MATPRTLVIACVTVLALSSACSGSSEPTPPPPPPSASASGVAASPASAVADGAAAVTVTVTLRTATDAPVAGRTVTLSSSRGAADAISAASGPSDASGVVTFAVRSTVAGASTFTARDPADDVTVEQTASATFTPGPADALQSSVAASPDTVVADGSASATITVTLRDAHANPVPGSTVSLASSRGAADLVSAASGPSDAGGVVTFTASSTAAGATTFTALDATDAVSLTQTAVVSFTAGLTAAAQSTVAASPPSVVADGTSSAVVTVTLRDAHGNPVPGQIVTLASSRGAADAIVPDSGVSDAEGVVSFVVGSTSAGSSTFTATDASDALILLQAPSVTFVPGPVASTASTVVAAPASVVADGTATSTVTVTLRDAHSNAVPGKTVTLSSSRGATDTISAASGPSSASGAVTFTVSSTAAGAPAFTALDATDSVTVAQAATVSFTAGLPTAAQSTVTASPASVVADGTSPAVVTVTLRDAHGNPVPGKTVTLASSRGAADAIVPDSGASDAEGVVAFAVVSTSAGSSTFTATDASDALTLPQTPSVTFVPGPVAPAASTVAAVPASVVADGSTLSTVTVTLHDAHSNAVPGKTVTLSSSRGAADTISAASGPSSASGTVTFTVKSTASGLATFAATDVTDAIPLTETGSVTFTAGPVSWQQSAFSVSPTSVVADGVAASTLTVTLRDAYGNPVPGKSVAIYHLEWPPLGTTSAASGPSDASGVVTFTLTSTTSGTATVLAVDVTDNMGVGDWTNVTFTAGPVVEARSTVTASSPTAFANGAATATVTVTLRDTNGNGVPGKVVTLVSSRGATDTISPASGTTNGSGAVAFGVGSSTFGSSTFSATDETDGIALGQTASVSFTRYLAFTTQPPASATAAVAFSPQPVVVLQDGNGNVDAAFHGTVTLAIASNPAGGTLSGTTVVAAVSGVAAFSGVSIDKAGTGYVLAASDAADGLPPSTSRAFDVVVGAPSKLAFAIQPSNSGGGIGPTFQVAVQDAGGNQTASTGFPVTVAIGTNPSGGVLTGTAAAASRNGVATFTGLGIAEPGAGYTLVATDTTDGLAAATSAPFDVKPPVVVGTGTAGSCTEAALDTALAAGGNVTFGCGASPVTITFTSTKTISVNTSLDGGGLVTLSGGGARPLFTINAGVTTALSNLTVTGGFSGGNGGAITTSGTLSITRCTVSGNATSSANDYYGSPANGGAIFGGGTLIVASSTFSGNAAASVNDFYGTSANGGAIFTWGTLLVTNSTFANNTATGSNSYYGTAGNGGAIFNAGGTVAITSSTFSGNAASGTAYAYGTTGRGGALYGGAALTNTIVAGSPSGGNCSGTFTNGGHDLDSDGSCGVGAATNPQLAAAGLAANGGPTQTIAIEAASPAVNAGDQTICAAAPVLGVDQRGYGRPGTGASSCSIGAFEYDAL